MSKKDKINNFPELPSFGGVGGGQLSLGRAGGVKPSLGGAGEGL
ncbi:hypothetical protein BH23BAC2_BH23BAC2_09500 [soil metagenome]